MKLKLGDVFKTVGLPPFTYVKPPYYPEVRADMEQAGRHILIEGPSGIGKSCVIWKAIEELGWIDGQQFRYISCRDNNAPRIFDEFMSLAIEGIPTPWPALIVDDFHLLVESVKDELGSRLKRIADYVFTGQPAAKLILIGIPASGASLLADAKDLGPRLGSYRPHRADDREIRALIAEGEQALQVLFSDETTLLGEIDGNFWLAQYVCNKICALNSIFETADAPAILAFDMLTIRRRLMEELTPRFLDTAAQFSKGKKWRPGGNKPYMEVFLALKQVPESVVSYDRVLATVPERRRPGLKAIRSRVASVIHNPGKNVDLRKQIAFSEDSFSIEDPLFRYFMNYLNPDDLFARLGIDPQAADRDRAYPYDIGFSFAGEVRDLVEIVNAELKEEDVVTFYDYDQQAFLLALNLEETLARIYSESCRYYLVFMDACYRNKVWTKYERDIMTRPGRANHIIPVVIDDEGLAGTVGIPNTIARIDLRDIWSGHQPGSEWTPEARQVVRNRCILPVVEKLDAGPLGTNV